ncbi:Tbc1d10b [Symbiodinium natans]|uniref:Tbc1d10b protein n=1 Tax=Symbiodinium natans TaxID=878477 RepID=A0A812QVP5_9DINO|nr:Tbc1d10b [Symbiodinium natans]
MGCGCVSQHQVGIPGGGPRQFLYTATDKEFVRTLDKEELKEKNLLLTYFRLDHEGHFVVTDGFRDLVRRKGVPRRYRWRAWRALTGWSALSKPGWYERIMRKAPDSKTVEAIEKDLDRTFPGVEDFDDRKKRELANMLRAHAGLFPSVGYCQGMNFVAGFLLLVAGRVPDAAKDAFFLLVQMMVKYRANLLFCDGLPLLKLHTFQYRILLQRLFPDVHRHFTENQITPELYLTKWILTLFTQPLCFDAAARVWDLIVCDGLQAVVLIALGVVKLWRSRLLQEDTEGILEMLSMRDGEPLAGGEIVKAALALESQIAPGSQGTLLATGRQCSSGGSMPSFALHAQAVQRE